MQVECISTNENVKFSGNKKRGHKKVCRNQSKLTKDNLKLQETNEKLKRQVAMHKKGWQRQIKTQNQTPVEQLTPKRKTIVTMEKYFKGKVTRHHPVACQLFLHNVLKNKP